MNETLSQLMEFLKEASPMVWETLIKQVYVEAVRDFTWSILFFIVCFFLVKTGVYGQKQSEENYNSDWSSGMWFAYIGAGISGLIALIVLSSVITHVINPEFYAIRFILYSISGG